MDRGLNPERQSAGSELRPTLKRLLVGLTGAGLIAVALTASSAAETSTAGSAALVALPGHVHRFTRAATDAGEAPDTTQVHGLDLVLAKTPAQEKALAQFLADLQDPKSPQYHHWLTPAGFGRRFGASDAVIGSLSQWLESNGLQVGEVPVSRAHLPFTGTKAQVEAAFHTAIHLFDLKGKRHYANVSDPMVPAAVEPLIRSVRGLNDFAPRPGVRPERAAPRASPSATPSPPSGALRAHPDTYYSGTGQYPGYVGPSDFAAMYNLKPLYQSNITGAGVTVVIAAQSDISASVLASFWSAFSVSGTSFGLPAQSFTSMPVPAANGGSDPGQTHDSNEDEAYLDTEIVGGLAPGAALILVRDASALTAAQYAIDQNLGAVLNISFGTCESGQPSENATVNSIYQQAVGEGITITVSSADAGAASCTAEMDLGNLNDVNSNGFAVNGLASTPYNLAVGGTDFNPSTETSSWSTTNGAGFETASGHIPEMVWNDSCANPVIASSFGIPDPIAFCNTANISGVGANPFILISGGGGGLSSCTTTTGAGNCNGGYPQPAWQANVAGISNFGTRALPDVSMIATRWLLCSWENKTCNPANAPTFPPAAGDTIKVLEGTSAAAPSVAAIIAMVDQTQISGKSADGRQGLINPKLYQLAGVEYASATNLSACSADQARITNAACVFYDIVSGSNAQPCNVSSYATSMVEQRSLPASTCGHASGDQYGIMEINGVQDYAASAGFDIATGLGSINAAALVGTFVPLAPTGLAAAAAGAGALKLTWTASADAASYNVYEGTKAGGESGTASQTGISGSPDTVTGLTAGQQYFFELKAVNGAGASALSTEASATVVPAVPMGLAATAGNAMVTLSWSAATGAASYNVYQGTAAGGESATPVQTGLTSPTATVSGLMNGTHYYFTVAAVDAGGASAQSSEASATPAAPGGGGGGGALDWLGLGGLAALAARRFPASFRRTPSSRPRAERRRCR